MRELYQQALSSGAYDVYVVGTKITDGDRRQLPSTHTHRLNPHEGARNKSRPNLKDELKHVVMVATDEIQDHNQIGLAGDFWVSDSHVQVRTQNGWVPLDGVQRHPALPHSTFKPLYRAVVNTLVYGKHSVRQECFKHWNMHSNSDLVEMWERCYNIRLSEERKEQVISVRQSVDTFGHLTSEQIASLIATMRSDQLTQEDIGSHVVATRARRIPKSKPEPQPVLFWWVSSTPVIAALPPEPASATQAKVSIPEPKLDSAGKSCFICQIHHA